MILEMRNICKDYPMGKSVNHILKHIDLDVEAGEYLAIMGPSGSGKTTICSLLPRFYDVTAGRITIDDQDIRHLTLKSLRSQIGMVQQDVYLFSGTIRDNIAYGKPDASDEEIIAAAKRANIHDFIMELPQQYETFVGERGARLSGGQKQRLLIARALAGNSPILVLDDSSSALDYKTDASLRQAIRDHMENTTSIIIAQRITSVMDADMIVILDDGKVHAVGTHKELLANDTIYQEIYASQMKGDDADGKGIQR